MSDILKHVEDEVEADKLKQGEIVENACLFIIAGSDGSGTNMSGISFQLLTNPDRYKKLVGEIRSTFQRKEDITMLKVAELKYLGAVFEEGLRMCKSFHNLAGVCVGEFNLANEMEQSLQLPCFSQGECLKKERLSRDTGYQRT